jgi:dTDP-4-amino-4,6-dideoxygalactose transaminase
MKPSRIPLNRLRPSKEFEECVFDDFRAVIERGWLIQGPEHERFEKAFAEYCGAKACVAVGNGTDALEIALRAVGVTRGDEVVVQPNAGFYGTTAILAIDAVPVYADIESEHHQISLDSVRRCLSSKTRAVIMTHLYGKMGDVVALGALCREKGVPLIEDCAQAHGAIMDGRRAGSFGDASAFSFYPTKNLGAFGDGGAVVTSSEEIASKARKLRQYGWVSKYTVVSPGRNSRLDELQAVVLNRRLPLLDQENEVRRTIVRKYAASARGGLKFLHAIHGSEYVGHLAVTLHPSRESVERHFHEAGIATAIHYPVPDHLQPCMAGIPYRRDDLCVTEEVMRQILTLPCHPGMDEEEINRICELLTEAPWQS